jgi:hypothetical protein
MRERRESVCVGQWRVVGLQQPQDCMTERGCCILEQGLQQLLEPLQELFFLQNEDAAAFA